MKKQQLVLAFPVMHMRSLVLGIVSGLTLTAVIVSAQSFMGLNEFNTRISQAVDSLKSVYQRNIGAADSDNEVIPQAAYPSLERVAATNTTDWQVYVNEEFGISFSYPGDWKIETQGLLDCRNTESQAGCFSIILAHDASKSSVIVSTNSEFVPIRELVRTPVVGYIQNQELIFSQYRPSLCSAINESRVCVADPDADVQFTSVQETLSGFHVFILADVITQEAAVVNSLRVP